MRRRWIADNWTPTTGHPTQAALTGEQATHLVRVLRATPGQVFDVVANGFLHRAEIVEIRAANGSGQDCKVLFTLHEELQADAALPIHLLLSVFKFDRFEWVIEKATELGVARITPILARRTEKHLALASAKRVERWRRIALEAAQQSRRTDVPTISGPTPLAAALASESAPTRILLSETEQSLTLAAALTQSTSEVGAPHLASEMWDRAAAGLALAIGPEGGWAPEEIALFIQHAWTEVTLGPRILRAETSAIAAIAIVAAHLNV